MSAAAPTVDITRAGPADAVIGAVRRNIWTLGLLAFLALLLLFTRFIQPTYGPTGIQGLANSVLPLALAAVAQAIVVIVESEGRTVAVQIDELVGQQQVVIKSQEANYRRVRGVSGATILGDGRVSLILDVAAIVRLFSQSVAA